MRTSKEMQDSELRGIVLERFYRRRRELNHIQLGPEDFADVVEELYAEDILRAADQLGEYGLLDWKRPEGGAGELINGWGKITAYGVDVVEGRTSPVGIAVTIDSRSYTFNRSSHNIVGDNNVQVGNVTVANLVSQIDAAAASAQKKKEAKGVIARAFEHPAVGAVLASVADGVARAFKD